jgi:cobalt-zinc-cadmium efflux system protein
MTASEHTHGVHGSGSSSNNHDHDHDHDHSHDESAAEQPVERVNRRPLVIALAITTTFLVIEVIGALLTNSLALLADAGHMLTDVAALALALFAMWLANRPATPVRSFGFYRAEILAALVNATTLVVVSLYIFWEAFQRIGEPPHIESGPMLVVAIAGLAANAASAWVLMRGGGHEHNLNTRGAFLHVVSDMLGSVGAIIAALVMLATGWYLADPILSALIGGLILWSAWRLLKESVDVLLESTPKHIDPGAVREAMEAVPGVQGVHDLHIWTVTSGLVAMSGHVEIAQDDDWHATLGTLSALLRDKFGIAHVTLQPEEPHGADDAFRGCSLDAPFDCACRVPGRLPALATGHAGHRH